ncbi:asparaginase [Streptomyces cavernicola]|uniref:Asparaginase n=1 Tax=Streptomyces cavernicola TaxID=3043613 RepID=A0ABT6S7X9_9ACTN|nr:asparaginase [Streptomyces sp. B-S-A6]MDI3404206.1 asparaginase [Streptomyces sp. B-S-A6]
MTAGTTERPPVELARVVRGGFVESRHLGHVVVVAPDGTVKESWGDPDALILPRSSLKPFQALAALTAGADLSGRTLAVACGSHTGEPFHTEAVDAILNGSGLTRAALRNVPGLPENTDARDALVRAGRGPERIVMNCSGKHAAMLAACVHQGLDTATYTDPDHPVQRHMYDTLARLSGAPTGTVVVDGCGAPCPALPLSGLARAGAALATAAPGSPERAVAEAMRAHPEYIGGTGHLNTRFAQLISGSLAKGGAEGVFLAALADGTTVAVKAVDGSPRATTAVAVAALRATGQALPPLPELEDVPVEGGGRRVGAVHTVIGKPVGNPEGSR